MTIGLHARDLLLGQSASRAVQCELVRAAAQDPLLQAPPRLATMHLGPDDLLVVGDLAVPAGISVEDARRLAVGAEQRMRRAEPSVGQVYLRFDPDGDAAVDERND